MLILKEVKVVCFDTVLQVLILNLVSGRGLSRTAWVNEKNLGGAAPLSRVFAYEWQGKDLRDRECVRVANKGLARRAFCASRARRVNDDELGGVGIMARRGDWIGAGAGRCVGAEVGERRGERMVGEGCAAVVAQDTRLVN